MKLLENVKKLIEMYRIGETRKVLDVFDQEVLTIPDTQVFRKKGVISIDFEKNSDLQSFLDKILEINPQDPEIMSRKALIFFRTGLMSPTKATCSTGWTALAS